MATRPETMRVEKRQSLKRWLASFLDGLLDRLPVL
jgi:hypothetical protein